MLNMLPSSDVHTSEVVQTLDAQGRLEHPEWVLATSKSCVSSFVTAWRRSSRTRCAYCTVHQDSYHPPSRAGLTVGRYVFA